MALMKLPSSIIKAAAKWLSLPVTVSTVCVCLRRQGNMQRCKLVMDQVTEARDTMMKVLDHKEKVLKLLNKNGAVKKSSKLKRKERAWAGPSLLSTTTTVPSLQGGDGAAQNSVLWFATYNRMHPPYLPESGQREMTGGLEEAEQPVRNRFSLKTEHTRVWSVVGCIREANWTALPLFLSFFCSFSKRPQRPFLLT